MEHKCSTCSTSITYAGKIIMSSSDRLRQILNEHENSRPTLENNMSSFTYSRPISPTYHETTTTLQQSTENKIVPRAYLLTDNNNTKSGKFTESHYASSSYYAGKNCLLSNYQYIGKYNEEIKKEVSKPFLKYL